MRSILHDLKLMMPTRSLSFTEAIVLCDLQADKLLTWGGVAGPPVPEDLVASLPRVHIETVRPLGVSGASAWNNGEWQILLNADESPNRQRFSAVHELRHIIDHPRASIFYPPSGGMGSHERQEQIADYFAAAVLMPRRWVKRAWREGIQDQKELAQLFGVSRAAMSYRLINLGLIARRARCEVA